jgi:hypothetical protein
MQPCVPGTSIQIARYNNNNKCTDNTSVHRYERQIQVVLLWNSCDCSEQWTITANRPADQSLLADTAELLEPHLTCAVGKTIITTQRSLFLSVQSVCCPKRYSFTNYLQLLHWSHTPAGDLSFGLHTSCTEQELRVRPHEQHFLLDFCVKWSSCNVAIRRGHTRAVIIALQSVRSHQNAASTTSSDRVYLTKMTNRGLLNRQAVSALCLLLVRRRRCLPLFSNEWFGNSNPSVYPHLSIFVMLAFCVVNTRMLLNLQNHELTIYEIHRDSRTKKIVTSNERQRVK